MLFKNPPAALNGMIFAVIWRIIGQGDMQTCVPHEVHHARHELGVVAVIFGAIVKIDDQRSAVREPVPDGFPPLSDAIRETVTRDVGEHAIQKDLIASGYQDTDRGTGGGRVEIVIAGRSVCSAFPAPGARTDVDHRFGIHGNA
jgi:hypothetical protein